MAEVTVTKKLELGDKVDSVMDKTSANKQCLVMLEDYSKFVDRYNLICSTNIIEITKLKLAFSFTISTSNNKMIGRLWMLNKAQNGMDVINLFVD